MIHMLCRNRVRDFETWKAVFDSHVDAHRSAGLRLLHMWRRDGDLNEVFFLFEADDRQRAQEFVADPAGAEAGRIAGVLDGEIIFLEPAAVA